MKLYGWQCGFLGDNGDFAFAVAESEDEARQLVLAEAKRDLARYAKPPVADDDPRWESSDPDGMRNRPWDMFHTWRGVRDDVGKSPDKVMDLPAVMIC